ncbi:MAG: sigma-54-dependent Fis family transcriptional regulator [Candidatus Aminicenantes bacterium RBG_16_63_14]|nr:MAG: sigma-54-dependent Fis family transcriptional regulator [Candidatus Aminicenantes bacterium RBG_16_63_14]
MESPSDSPAGGQRLQILVVDDEANIRRTLTVCLETEGHHVVGVSNAADAIGEAARRSFDLAFIDLRLGTDDGLDLIPALQGKSPGLKVIVITAYASIDTAVEAIRRGATDYIPKPFTPAQISLAVRKVFEMRSLELKVAALQEDLVLEHPEVDFSSTNPRMKKAVDMARQTASSEATILLRGESGTGKTVLARDIHGWSRRAAKAFRMVSCPSFSSELLESELFGHVKGAFTSAIRDNPGRISASEGGTLFLDEIGDLPLALQPKLLRFVQDKEYERVGDDVTRKADVRLLAATNIDLEGAVKAGRFREDLFYRLNVIQIEIPPLRERPEDLDRLATRLLAFHARRNHRAFLGFSDEALSVLREYPWPGNVRELSNVIERAVILCRGERIGPEFLPPRLAPADACPQIGDPVSLEKVEEQHIRRVLAVTRSLQDAAKLLGIDQATLWRRRKKYNI